MERKPCETRVWWVQSKPFDGERRYAKEAENFQSECLKKKFFGMGWKEGSAELFDGHIGETISRPVAELFRIELRDRAFTTAQNRFLEMQVGDVVLTRLKGNYYLGVIATRPRMSDHELLTWTSEVKDDWSCLGKGEALPHHVRGKITGRDCHGTVAEIKGLSAVTLMQLAGVEHEEKNLNKDNFFYALGDEDLEDLMAHYMRDAHERYVFLPSSCKKDTPGVEYVMYDPKTGNKITCQTKVNERINLSDYKKEVYLRYERIYLFSGLGYLGETNSSNIYIVDRGELFRTLKRNRYFSDILKKYFKF